MRQKLPLIIFVILHIAILLAFFYGDIDRKATPTDVTRYFEYGTRMVNGQLPYRDFAIEYPPLALVFFLLPRLITTHPAIYGALFAVEMAICDAIGLLLISALSERLGLNRWASLAIGTVCLLTIGPIILQRYDLVPAVMTLGALYLFLQQKHRSAWAVLAIGTLTKLYPVVLAPVFALYYFRQRQYRTLVADASTFAVTAVVIVVPCLLLSASGFRESFAYHTGRGLQCESTYASALLFLETMGIGKLQTEFGAGSLNVTSPLADTLARFSPLFLLAALAIVYWLFYRQSGKKPPQGMVVNYALLAILVVIITSKVFSPQFIIWLYPLVPLVTGRWRHTSWLMFGLIGILTWYVFPAHYQQFIGMRQPAVIDILLWRNVLLVAWGVLLLGDTSVKKATTALAPGPDSIEKVVPERRHNNTEYLGDNVVDTRDIGE